MNLIQKRIKESLNLSLIESLLDEDYPSSFNMEHFNSLRSFSQRINYCESNLQRISSGSSRIVYKIDETKVLKLSKNQKGLAQTETEINWGNDSYFGSILAEVFHYSEDNLWVEMELARKVTKNDFIRIVGVPIEEVWKYLTDIYAQNNRKKSYFKPSPEIKEQLDENEFVQDLTEFMLQMGAQAGDFGRLNSYGLVKRDGHESIVLIDYGLTGEVYDNYYS